MSSKQGGVVSNKQGVMRETTTLNNNIEQGITRRVVASNKEQQK
jgi:hypothetical protein